MANPAHPIPSVANSVSFTFLSSKDVRNVSVLQVTNAQLFDNLNEPTLGGLYDPVLGPTKRGDMLV